MTILALTDQTDEEEIHDRYFCDSSHCHYFAGTFFVVIFSDERAGTQGQRLQRLVHKQNIYTQTQYTVYAVTNGQTHSHKQK